MPKAFATGFMVRPMAFDNIKTTYLYTEYTNELFKEDSISPVHKTIKSPALVAGDDFDPISESIHERFIVNAYKFNAYGKKQSVGQ